MKHYYGKGIFFLIKIKGGDHIIAQFRRRQIKKIFKEINKKFKHHQQGPCVLFFIKNNVFLIFAKLLPRIKPFLKYKNVLNNSQGRLDYLAFMLHSNSCKTAHTSQTVQLLAFIKLLLSQNSSVTANCSSVDLSLSVIDLFFTYICLTVITVISSLSLQK